MNAPVNYEDIRNTAPRRRTRPGRKGKIRAWQSFAYLAFAMAVMTLFGGILYLRTGSILAESFVQQIFFLVSAVLFAVLLRADLREVFPFRKPRLTAVFGVLVLILAAVLAAEMYGSLILYYAPDSLEQASENMQGLFNGPPLPVELLIVCLCPAVCEEAVHRGIVMSGLRTSFRDRRIMVFLGGVLFGLFHIYPVRMVVPCFIGFLLSWLLIQTDNMLYSCLLHFGYNAVLIVFSSISETVQPGEAALTITKELAGFSVLMTGVFIPMLVFFGTWLVRRATSPRIPGMLSDNTGRAAFVWTLAATAAILVLGLQLLYL